MRFAFIAVHTPEFHVTTMCRVLQVSKAGYYAWVNRPPSARAMDDAQLAETIKEIHGTSRRTYGSPRVHEELKAQGQQHGEKRVARIMQEEGLRAKTPRRFRVTTDSKHAHPIAPNVLDRQFAVEQVARAEPRVGGRHHVSHDARGLVVLGDRAGSRVAAGDRLGDAAHVGGRADAGRADDGAPGAGSPRPGLLHHSDRGSQYAATDYRALLTAHGMDCSMSRVGRLLGQRRRRELLRDAQARAGR